MLCLVIELALAVEHFQHWPWTQLKKTGDELAAVFGQHRFWMELDAPVRLVAVLDGLNDPITAASMHTEPGWKWLSNMQGVIADYPKVLREALEQAFAGVLQGAHNAVIRRPFNDAGTSVQSQALMAEAHPEEGNPISCLDNALCSREVSCFAGMSGARGNDDVRKLARANAGRDTELFDGLCAHHERLLAGVCCK